VESAKTAAIITVLFIPVPADPVKKSDWPLSARSTARRWSDDREVNWLKKKEEEEEEKRGRTPMKNIWKG
jgi:hypothetical protein